MLRKADFVTLHVPLTAETHSMIGEKEIKLMKKTSYLINTSCGKVIDEKTLLGQEVEDLKKEREKLESLIYKDKTLLQQTLSQALTNLKQERPDLFYLTGQDQIISLVRLFLGFITK